MAAKFFTGLPLDGPDPECVKGHGERALATVDAGSAPRPSLDHSHSTTPARPRVPLTLTTRPTVEHRPPVSACNDNPLAGFIPAESGR